MVLSSSIKTLEKYQVSTASWNELGFTQSWQRCSTIQYLQVQNLGGTEPFRPHLATRLAVVTDGNVVLIFLLRLQSRGQLTPATIRYIYVVSEICNRQQNV